MKTKQYEDCMLKCLIPEDFSKWELRCCAGEWYFTDEGTPTKDDYNSYSIVCVENEFAEIKKSSPLLPDHGINEYTESELKSILVHEAKIDCREIIRRKGNLLTRAVVYLPLVDVSETLEVSFNDRDGVQLSDWMPLLESIVFDPDQCKIEQKRENQERAEYTLSEIAAFHKAIFGWTREESYQAILNNGFFHITEKEISGEEEITFLGFYRETPMFWASLALLTPELKKEMEDQEWTGNDMADFAAEISIHVKDQCLRGLTHEAAMEKMERTKDIRCIDFTEDDWRESRKRINRLFEEAGLAYRIPEK